MIWKTIAILLAFAATVFGADISTTILATRPTLLKGYWKCNDLTGTTLTDSSGNGNDLAITGTQGSTYWLGESGVSSTAGSCFRTAASAYASRTTSVLGNLDNQNFTLFAFFKGTTAFGSPNAFGVSNSGTTNDRAAIGNASLSPTNATVSARGSDATTATLTGGTAFGDGNWHSIAFRRNGAVFDLFVDGVNAGTTTVTLTLGSLSNRTGLMHIITASTSSYATGSVQHAAIWSTNLLDSEILAIHQSGFYNEGVGGFKLGTRSHVIREPFWLLNNVDTMYYVTAGGVLQQLTIGPNLSFINGILNSIVSGGNVSTPGAAPTGSLAFFTGPTTINNGDLSGQVTTSGSNVTTLTPNTVSYSQIQQESALSVLGNPTNLTANPSEIPMAVNTIVGRAAGPAIAGLPLGANLAFGNASPFPLNVVPPAGFWFYGGGLSSGYPALGTGTSVVTANALTGTGTTAVRDTNATLNTPTTVGLTVLGVGNAANNPLIFGKRFTDISPLAPLMRFQDTVGNDLVAFGPTGSLTAGSIPPARIAWSDPGTDAIAGWDHTDLALRNITIGTGLSYDHPSHTLSATGGGGGGAPAGTGFAHVTGGVWDTPIADTGTSNVVRQNSPSINQPTVTSPVNNVNVLTIRRFTDTSPLGHFMSLNTAVGNTPLFSVAVDGTLDNGIVPEARVSWVNPGINAIRVWDSINNAPVNASIGAGLSYSHSGQTLSATSTLPTGTGFYHVTGGVADGIAIAQNGTGNVVGASAPTITDANFLNSTNGLNLISGARFTDASPSGHLINLTTAVGGTSLFSVDPTGSMDNGAVPEPRIVWTNPGGGSNRIRMWDNNTSAMVNALIGAGLSYSAGTKTLSATGTTPSGTGFVHVTGGAYDTPYSATGSGTVVALASAPSLTDATFGNSANGLSLISGKRFTDSSPAGNLINLTTNAGVSLLQVDYTGTLLAGSIPEARIVYTSPGANVIRMWDNTDNALVNAALGKRVVYDHASHTLNIRNRVNSAASVPAGTGTLSINTDNYDEFDLTALTENITTITLTGTPKQGDTITILIRDDNTGTRTIAWSPIVSLQTVTLPTVTVQNHWMYQTLVYNATIALWICTGTGVY
jgi:hypothetical protein